ncbi:uncharacterized protein LOC118460836 [Anopheles albimanus]|uniref:Chitin-binding type-2 domain-containing protein n=1 Tax=Anopheles albimanus TaxID=7167 RepID=A0A182FKR2_ANOAL|nr:uncharacterized protein LOC118460836 [Anopheles albimanus]
MRHIFKFTVLFTALIQSLVVSQTSLAYCPDATRPHATRCDQYLRCDNLANGDHVWTTVQCHKGLVYRQYIGTCVVPDNDWECDLSAEDDRNTNSDENVYGIDNLQYSAPSSTALDDGIELSRAIFPDDQESSGDGGLDQTFDEPVTSGSKNVENLSISQFKEPSVTSAATPTIKPTEDSSETTLQQLKKLIKHQQNWINTQMKRRNFLSGENGYFSATSSQEVHARVPTSSNSNSPATTSSEASKPAPGIVSEDIIRNLLNISQQLISNQKEAAALRTDVEKKPIVTQIYIPVPVGPSFQSSHPDYSSKILNNAQDPSVGVSLTNAYNIPQNYYTSQGNIGTRLQQNESIQQHPILYDGYGNQILPMSSNPQFGPFNPYQNPTQSPYTAHRPGQQNSPYSTPVNGPLLQAPFGSQGLYNNFQPLGSSVNYNQQPNNNFQQLVPSVNYNKQPDYAGQLASVNRNELLDQTASLDSDVDESSESDYAESKPSQAAISDELELSDFDDSDSSTSHLQMKLFALGDDTTLDYEQYKDSLMPMLEANPDDGRISVLTCSLGSRQPNRTDCFRYYVCNPHNGMFQTFTCPSNTAFNKVTRLCDTVSYKPCQTLKTEQQSQLQQLLREQGLPKRRKTHRKQQKNPTEKELLRTAQKYVALIRREAMKVLTRTNGAQQSVPLAVRRKAPISGSSNPVTRTSSTPTVQATPTTKPSRTAPRCRVEGRMADPVDFHNYYLCHRKSPKKFTKLKMACPTGLVYCAASQYCTLATNC